MLHFQILGQSNFGISVLLDCLSALHPEANIHADIVANVPAEENGSLAYPYKAPGITTRQYDASDWQPLPDATCLVGSIGKGRLPIVQFFQEHFGIEAARYGTTIHPSAVVAASVTLGHGIHISPLSVVAPHTYIGDFVVVNRNVSIGHHTVLEPFVSVNPGANIAGLCHIGARVVIGAGAVVIDQITIGAGSIIGAGSVVTRNIPAGVIAYGNPAKVIREI